MYHELSRCGDSASLRRVAIVDLNVEKCPSVLSLPRLWFLQNLQPPVS